MRRRRALVAVVPVLILNLRRAIEAIVRELRANATRIVSFGYQTA